MGSAVMAGEMGSEASAPPAPASETFAVVMDAPGSVCLRRLGLRAPADDELVVDIALSGISTGTERLLFTGEMPAFPGMGYPLVPGYESVGHVIDAGPAARARVGERVFVPGSTGFEGARGLFGGAAARVVVKSARAPALSAAVAEDEAVLLALAATAHHAVSGFALPELIIGHGVLGRLLARITLALGGNPIVWERNPARCDGAQGYQLCSPEQDERRDYRVICDASGDAALLDALIGRLGRGGEVVLAGFYPGQIAFAFAPAFMREARLRIAAEWQPEDLGAVHRLIEGGALSLAGLITHRRPAAHAAQAYATAFGDPACLKMIIDWSQCP